MPYTSPTNVLRMGLLAVPLAWFIAGGRTASADSREAAQAALAATVAVEWNEKEGTQAKIPGMELKVPGLEANQNYGWVGFGRPTAASFSSGTVVDAEGLIVAFAAGSDEGEVSVTLPDGQNLKATRLVVDRRSQLALLKVDATGLEAVPLGERRPEVGESVLAAMCVDTEDRIVAKGIVAAGKRNVDGFPFPLVQTDIQVTPMSAGGPLVNESGELVAVIVAMTAPDPDKGGPALAVPVEKVRALLDARGADDAQVVLESGFLGVALTEDDVAPVVSSVTEGSPAAHVDIEEGDRILAVDGAEVGSARELVDLIGGKMAGDVVALELERDGKPINVRVRLGERPRRQTAASQPADPDGAAQLKLEWIQPSKLYMLDKDGKVQTVDPKVDLKLLYPATEAGETLQYKKLAELQRAYGDAIKQLAPPQTPVLRVERTELDTKLETLTAEVESLRKQVEILTEQLKQLREHLRDE